MFRQFRFILFVSFATLFAPALHASNECQLESFSRIEQQFALGVFGTDAAQYFTNNVRDQRKLKTLTSDDVLRCTGDIPALSNQVVGVFTSVVIGLSVIIASTAIASIFISLSSSMMAETRGEGRNHKIRQFGMAIVVLLLAAPIGLLTGSGVSAQSGSYSIINMAMFRMMGAASIAADKIDKQFAKNTQSSLPFYLPPHPNYLTTKLSEQDDVGYVLNDMSHLLRFASCVITELPASAHGAVVSGIKFSQTDTSHKASYGNSDNACNLTITMPKNISTPAQMAETNMSVSREVWQDKEAQLFANAVRNAVQSALDFKTAQFTSLGSSFSIKTGDKLPVLDPEWYKTCPANLADISSYVTGQRSEIGELVAEERRAELCLSQALVSRFYSPNYKFNGTRTEYQPQCAIDNLKACAEELCRFDPAANQTGIFDCAVVVDVLAQGNHVEKIARLGWIAKPLDLMSLIERNAPPVVPQRSLAEWSFVSQVAMTEAGPFDFGHRDIYSRFREAIYDTGVGRLTPKDLLARTQTDSTPNHDIFSILRVDTCLNNPNQSLENAEGEVVGVCGTPIQTLRSLGNKMIDFYIALQAGNHLTPVATKMLSKQGADKKAQSGDGKIEGIQTGALSKSKAIAGVTAAVGGGIAAYLPEIKTALADKPFSPPSDAIFSVLSGVTAFTAGAVLTEGTLSMSHMILFMGFALKYLLPLIIVAPFYAGILWSLMAGLTLIATTLLLVIQPLVAPQELARKYTDLLLKGVSLVVTFVGLILMYYLSIILSERLLPEVLGGVTQLAGHVNNLSGTITSILFGVVVYTLLYVIFVMVLVGKLLDVYKQASEFNTALFQDGSQTQIGGEQTINAAKQKTDFAKSLTR
ncbi:hypothetical protein BGK46_06120 [Salinivibrio sp. SS2]|nr:hypothetical protein BGK46_06120 [Salinivibrio sp. DV]